LLFWNFLHFIYIEKKYNKDGFILVSDNQFL